MEKRNKLNLTKLSEDELNSREMNNLKGGGEPDDDCPANCGTIEPPHDDSKDFWKNA